MLPDTVLGHYRILSPLGKGGMGEVYAAEDTKLKRTVALKILPQGVSVDPDRRTRFEREAQAVAALNHPNIVTIYSVEEASGVLFLTMELIEGRTLKDVMADGALPFETLLRIATAVSDAMAAAHQRGITHRDLKPGNVMVTPEGRVKVLDFGLAKLQETQLEAGPDQQTRLRTDDLTGEGRIIGTVAYMSPEQAEGKPVDQRSDIFSLGVMLHEMAVGERPFKGDTDISVISSILKDTPSSVTDIKPDLPPGLARIVRRCLAKDPGRRYQTATDVRNDLEELKQDLDSGVQSVARMSAASVRPRPARPARPAMKWLIVAGAAAVVLAAGVFAWMRWGPGRARQASPAFTADHFVRLTDSGAAFLAEISPDGHYVVHGKRENGLPSVWVRQTATTSDVRIVPPAEVQYDGLTFSFDGNYVYYVTYPPTRGIGTLFKVPVLGGAPLRILEDIDGAPAFSPDGRSFAFIRGDVVRGAHHLMIANADGTGARILTTTSGEMPFLNEKPAWSPDGRTILAAASDNRQKYAVLAVDAAEGSAKQVGDFWLFVRDIQWMPQGGTFLANGIDRTTTTSPQLWEVSFPAGARRRITNDLNGYVGVSVSSDGRRLATVQSTTDTRVWVVPAAGGVGSEVAISGRFPGRAGIAWTPDGRLVFSAQSGGVPQVWIANADGSDARQLTNAERFANSPAVSPDGSSIYYVSEGTNTRIWRMGLDGSNQRPIATEKEAFRPIVSLDNQWIYFATPAETGQNRVMKMKTDGSGVSALARTSFGLLDLSPDGAQLLGLAWNQARQRSEYAVLPVAGGEPKLLGDFGTGGGAIMGTLRWGRTTETMAYAALREGRVNIFERPLAGGPEHQVTHFPRDDWPLVFAGALSHDGRLAVVRGNSKSDVVLIEATEPPK
jgi:Tol biopolymer transport system component/predicted Ser/Thr protein kinase